MTAPRRPEVPYRTIVADPPWSYAREGVRGAAAGHYGTMSRDDIAALPVEALAADDAHLYLWVTVPLLAEARPFEILAGWGFRYVTMLTWHKVGGERGIGMGSYFRGETEHVLFGVRGHLPIPPARRLRNHLQAPFQAHSTKPPAFYELVEHVSPGPRLELFARRRRFGWDAWGDQAPEFAASQAHLDLVAPT